jgi:hypothetical protein
MGQWARCPGPERDLTGQHTTPGCRADRVSTQQGVSLCNDVRPGSSAHCHSVCLGKARPGLDSPEPESAVLPAGLSSISLIRHRPDSDKSHGDLEGAGPETGVHTTNLPANSLQLERRGREFALISRQALAT